MWNYKEIHYLNGGNYINHSSWRKAFTLMESTCPFRAPIRQAVRTRPAAHPRGTREKALRVHLSIPEIQERRLS